MEITNTEGIYGTRGSLQTAVFTVERQRRDSKEDMMFEPL
jgi:hypothetical protein